MYRRRADLRAENAVVPGRARGAKNAAATGRSGREIRSHMRILFLNQYLPPDPAPTGVLLGEVAGRLALEGHEVELVSARQEYRGGQAKRGRLMRELKALWNLLRDGCGKRRVGLVISATSPPCLLLVASMVAAWHRAKSIHWVMDLYPELAVMLGEVRGGRGESLLKKVMGWCYRRCARVIALDGDMVERLRPYGIEALVVGVWVSGALANGRALEAGPAAATAGWTWIYSGNLGRAHEWETLLETQALLEAAHSDITLRFQGGGPAWPAAQARARELGLRRCEWLPYVEESALRGSLLRCQCAVVTQLPAARGLLWPSKLGLLLSLPQPLLWVGPVDGAIAGRLRALPQAGIFAVGQQREIAAWLLAARQPAGAVKISDPAVEREAGLEQWAQLVRELSPA